MRTRSLSIFLLSFVPLFFMPLFFADLVMATGESRSANARVNDSIVYHGKVVRPEGTPLEGSVLVRIKIYSPEPSVCLLWSEQQTVVAKKGGFSMELGYSENRIAGPNGGVAADFRSVFINNTGLTHASASCAVGSSYTPTSNDDRLMSAEFVDGGVSVAVEKIPIKSVPFAKQASEIGGFGIANLFKISGGGSAEQFSPEEVTRLKAASTGGSANQILGIGGTGGVVEYKSITAGTGIAVTHTSNGIQISATGGGGTGSVTNVGVSGLPLSVTNGSSTPTISIAQASSSQAGYLSAADWAAFNAKQAAGSFLTSISGSDVISALGYTPISRTSPSEVIGALGYSPQAALGFTPVNKAGDSMSGALNLPSNGLAVGSSQLVVSGGNVGIGTTSPAFKLHIINSSGNAYSLLENADVDAYTGVDVKNDVGTVTELGIAGTAKGTYGVIGAGDSYLYSNGAMLNVLADNSNGVIRFGTGGGGSTERMRITNTGNIGIGTTTPGDKLHVAGKIRAQEICDESGGNCKVISGGWTAGSVTSVGVGGAPLSVVNGTSTPTISIAQANGSQAGFLSAADWTSFNNKQPAGAYLTSISGAQVTAALGYTPISATSSSQVISALGFTPQAALGFDPVSNALPTNHTYIGNGSSVAATGFFGVGHLRNSSGTAQFPSSCSASQTLTWSAVTDVFSCTNIGSLPASAITTGTIDSARLPFGAGLWQDGGSGKIYYDGGNVGIGTSSPNQKLTIFDSVSSWGTAATIRRTDNTKNSALYFDNVNTALSSSAPQYYVGLPSNEEKFSIWTWDGSVANHRLSIDPTGNVGVGNLNPVAKLHLRGNFLAGNTSALPPSGPPMYVNNGIAYDNTAPVFGLATWMGSGNYGNTLNFFQSGGTAEGDYTIVAADRKIGSIEAFASNGSAPSLTSNILMDVDGSPSGANVPGRISFGVRNSAGTFGTAMTIKNNGNVGIGTTTPSHALQISRSVSGENSTYNEVALRISNPLQALGTGGEYSQTGIGFGRNDEVRGAIMYGTYGLDYMDFYTSDAGLTGSPRMRIAADGSVGIGTTTPGYKLDVQGGDINASGSVRAAGVALSSDLRFKKDISELDESLKKVLSIRGVSYNWRAKEFPERHFNDRKQVGVIAQEIEKQFPEVVDTDQDGYKSVNYPALVAPLINAIRELYARFVSDAAEWRLKAQKLEAENLEIKSYLCQKDPTAPFCH